MKSLMEFIEGNPTPAGNIVPFWTKAGLAWLEDVREGAGSNNKVVAVCTPRHGKTQYYEACNRLQEIYDGTQRTTS